MSEHQPTAWPSFFMDMHFLIVLFPAGVYMCFTELRDEHIFVIIYAVVGSYFAGVMVRLMLTLTPVVCVSAAVALSSLLDRYIDPTEPEDTAEVKEGENGVPPTVPGTAEPTKSVTKKGKKAGSAATSDKSASDKLDAYATNAMNRLMGKVTDKKGPGVFGMLTRLVVITNAVWMLASFVYHCTWVTSNAYSSPSVVLSSQNQDGTKHIIDDFREAYYWLRQNTPETAVVMSWWDYGYQIAGMADRPTLVDNNTWNNSKELTLIFGSF